MHEENKALPMAKALCDLHNKHVKEGEIVDALDAVAQFVALVCLSLSRQDARDAKARLPLILLAVSAYLDVVEDSEGEGHVH